MKFLCFCIGIFAASLCTAQQGTVKSQIVTQTSSGSTTPGTSLTGQSATGTSATTGQNVQNTTTVTPSAGIQTGSLTPLTAVPTQTAGSIVGGSNTTASTTPFLQNTTNLFGQIVGVRTNVQTSAAVGTQTGGGAFSQTGGTISQTGGTVQPPGFTQVMITLQGTVQSELDRQAILNRFQGLPGFVVVDQLQIAGAPGSTVNEAAGAATPIGSGLTNSVVSP